MKLPSYIEGSFDKWRQSFSFFEKVSVRFSETDMFGHMNNVTPFIYFEEARISYFKHLQAMDDLTVSRTIPVVASQQCDYLRQVMLHENVNMASKRQLSDKRRSRSITWRKTKRGFLVLQEKPSWFKLQGIRGNPKAGQTNKKTNCQVHFLRNNMQGEKR
ncbi:hypothetical protein BGLY_3376 [Bacillus glycinifermentans]|nr:hypothetical protein BGLY_3376 [Bacillus glycinifermentans]